MNIFSKTGLILEKDLRGHLRSGAILAATPFFAVLILAVMAFALRGSQSTPITSDLAAGILWVAIIFSSVTTFNQTFAAEKENGCLKGLLLCPVDRSLIYLAKLLANFIIITISQVITVPLFILFFGPAANLAGLAVVVLLGVAGLCSVGTLLSAISSASRWREILFPILFFPLAVPLVLAGAGAGSRMLSGQPLGESASWLVVLAAYTVLFTAVSIMVFDATLDGS